jgi:hypothetical protein
MWGLFILPNLWGNQPGKMEANPTDKRTFQLTCNGQLLGALTGMA